MKFEGPGVFLDTENLAEIACGHQRRAMREPEAGWSMSGGVRRLASMVTLMASVLGPKQNGIVPNSPALQ